MGIDAMRAERWLRASEVALLLIGSGFLIRMWLMGSSDLPIVADAGHRVGATGPAWIAPPAPTAIYVDTVNGKSQNDCTAGPDASVPNACPDYSTVLRKYGNANGCLNVRGPDTTIYWYTGGTLPDNHEAIRLCATTDADSGTSDSGAMPGGDGSGMYYRLISLYGALVDGATIPLVPPYPPMPLTQGYTTSLNASGVYYDIGTQGSTTPNFLKSIGCTDAGVEFLNADGGVGVDPTQTVVHYFW
jgi:hypothetical protein